jgi:Tfp pilus assembly protein PilO
MTTSKQWTLGAIALSLLILVAGFLLLVQPKRGEAASLQEQTQGQEDQAAALTAKVAQLRAQEKDLPAQQAKLAEIRTRLPETPALPSLIRSLTVAADAAGAELITLAPSAPVDAVGASTTPKQSAAATTDASTSSATAAAAAPGVSASVLKEIPIKVVATGGYASLTRFLNQVEGLQRSMLVTGVEVGKDGEEAQDGLLTLTLNASVFLTADAPVQQTAVAGGPASTPAAAPAAAE